MEQAAELLWRAALRRPWTKRPLKTDVEAMAAALAPGDVIDRVFRARWAGTSSGALAITSGALLFGQARPRQHFTEMLRLARPGHRHGPRALVIPRSDVRKVSVTSEGVAVHTDNQVIALLTKGDPELRTALFRLSHRSVRSDPDNPKSRTRVLPHEALWNTRHPQGGNRIERRYWPTPTGTLQDAGDAWRRLPPWSQWALAVGVFVGLQTFVAPVGVLFAILLLTLLGLTGEAAVERRRLALTGPETELAEADWIEARVAGAACRAWEATLREPSWSSPALDATRAAFDGDHEVDAVIDLALRIHDARTQLGAMPTGPARVIWQQQWTALDAAAERLGERADALIRHREQAAQLSRELAQLAELERFERSALVVDDLTIAMSVGGERAGLSPVADDIAGTRAAVRELIELMTDTRAPLATPVDAP
ncbi:hypothetical protein O2W15_20605 [Modestobacter sp. VKM Ac-2979]|uniref:hypothetical protein n=1 Tax=unclassified Modestobacter TaxID=2643866 RepID=UPI0022AB5415|nr:MULTISPECIES: hypothetical protein [unclassified Modestobacter]MCZ2813840.1 hypothetical protein [Modestobacter sp. VKM Ac-2979]MCZ2844185.1 hypothetical protein [Modestobacter sp. VKM Ac-2980]